MTQATLAAIFYDMTTRRVSRVLVLDPPHDTPMELRARARAGEGVILTNPQTMRDLPSLLQARGLITD